MLKDLHYTSTCYPTNYLLPLQHSTALFKGNPTYIGKTHDIQNQSIEETCSEETNPPLASEPTLLHHRCISRRRKDKSETETNI